MALKLDLPKKDKNGNSYLTYSQINLFKRDRFEYKDIYIDGRPFQPNAYTDFGNKVGKSLESGDFSQFECEEIGVLNQVTRLDLFERKTVLEYDGFNIYGAIDTCDKETSTIIDYKTGGRNKEVQYSNKDYNQIHIYALSIMQETGIKPDYGGVEFIRRVGDPRHESLSIGIEHPIIIDIDISLNSIKSVYWDILETAKEIESFYKSIK